VSTDDVLAGGVNGWTASAAGGGAAAAAPEEGWSDMCWSPLGGLEHGYARTRGSWPGWHAPAVADELTIYAVPEVRRGPVLP
jgi:hypothetical protein